MGPAMPVVVQTQGGERVLSAAGADVGILRRHGKTVKVANGMLIAGRLSGGREDLVRHGWVQ